MYRANRVGVVVPALNEELHIAAVLQRMPRWVDAVYVVDDGSTDRTRQIVRRFADADSRVQLISHTLNRGVGAAIVTGYRHCLAGGMDIVAVMAGDNQMDPVLLPAMLEPVVEKRAHYAKGTRMLVRGHRHGMSRWRIFGNLLLRWLTLVATGNRAITDPQNGYTAISRGALEQLDLAAVYPYYGYCNDLITRLTVLQLRIVEIPTPQVINRGQTSKIRYGSYVVRVSGLLVRCFLFRAAYLLARLRVHQPSDCEVKRYENPSSVTAYRRR